LFCNFRNDSVKYFLYAVESRGRVSEYVSD